MCNDVLIGQRLHPATKRARAAAPDQQQVIFGQEVGDELVVTRRRTMGNRLHGEPARPEPPGGAPMDLTNGSRVVRGELEARELREERMDAIPTAVLEPDHEEVRALELLHEPRGIAAPQHVVGELRGEAAEDRDAQQERARDIR